MQVTLLQSKFIKSYQPITVLYTWPKVSVIWIRSATNFYCTSRHSTLVC